MADRIDWTQLLVPQTNDDGTMDYVTIPSAAALRNRNNLFRAKVSTDFARRNYRTTHWLHRPNGVVYRDAYEGVYHLRDSEQVTDGTKLMTLVNPHNNEAGVSPCVKVQLPAGYTMEQLKEQYGLTKQTTAKGRKYYQVQIGEYPRTKVTGSTAHSLNQRFNAMEAADDFYCTGRLFSSIYGSDDEVVEVSSLHFPEYFYAGKRYLSVANVIGSPDWYEVEPINWWVKNAAEVESGRASYLDLETCEVLITGMPFLDKNAVRAFLNSASSRQWQGNAAGRPGVNCNYTLTGWLHQALNMTREPDRIYIAPANENKIENFGFAGCRGLEQIIIPSHVRSIGDQPFQDCNQAQVWFELSERDFEFSPSYDFRYNAEYVYLPKTVDNKWLVLSPYLDLKLEANFFRRPVDYRNSLDFFERNYRENCIQVANWKNSRKIKFIPPKYILKTFPSCTMQNFFVNNNHKRWAQLTQALHFELLERDQKSNSYTDLLKIYYALGGFSANQGARDKAYNYIVQHVAKKRMEKEDAQEMLSLLTELKDWYVKQGIPKDEEVFSEETTQARWVGSDIHSRFSRLELTGPYNPTFAQFFMKYYHENPDFMKFNFYQQEQDYLCAAHNHFDRILQTFPNRVVNGNTERNLLTPEFVAEHSTVASYTVEEDNMALGEMLAHYGYTQDQFDVAQQIFNQAKKNKDQAVICAPATTTPNGISFRVLAKDDPFGFVIGDITNCCQHIGGAAESCVRDGYVNPHAGFLVFEADFADAQPTVASRNTKRVLGQAYVWYDPQTQTVCYDNIEVPKKIVTALQQGEKQQGSLSMSGFMQAVLDSAAAIMTTMNQAGTPVERVTVGRSYNDLQDELQSHFRMEKVPAVHRSYKGYTDAGKQFLICTYNQTKTKVATKLTQLAANTSSGLKKLVANLSNDQGQTR